MPWKRSLFEKVKTKILEDAVKSEKAYNLSLNPRDGTLIPCHKFDFTLKLKFKKEIEIFSCCMKSWFSAVCNWEQQHDDDAVRGKFLPKS